MNNDDLPVTPRQKAGIVLFVLSVGVLTSEYWRTDGSLPLIGPASIWVLTAITASMGALSFWLIGQKPETRRIGLLAGALAGAGCALAFHLVYGGVNRAGPERIFISLAGMAPGLLIGHLLVRRFERKLKASAPVPPAQDQ
jgi:hypothetical protein